jgi:2-oxoglutarate ferredoxin oxidoreductase subunit alpha
LHRGELSPAACVVADEDFHLTEDRCMSVPLKKLSEGGFTNVAALGVAASLLGLKEEIVLRTLNDVVGEAHPEVAERNQRALNAAFQWAAGKGRDFDKLPPISEPQHRLVMNAHEAVALGAISAGLKFCAFYPMSPSTSIAMTLIRWAKEMGLVVEQAEDEIAAINMGIGASYAGAPAMVPTSGGGFALMVEAVSLAAISETPVVVVIAQRPGPATGLATRTEQGELWFVLHAGHGEFVRAIFAPGTIGECFHLTRKAFDLAERYQGPVFVLTDHFFADSYRDADPFDVEELPFVRPGADPSSVEAPYLRYRITGDGVSPRLLPGMSEHLVVADSHEHTENGRLTEDLSIRPKMVDKRLRKGDGIRTEAVPPVFLGDEDPDVLLVSWGSSKGTVEEVAAYLRAQGRGTATLHFSQVWPLVPEHFLDHLQRARQTICVESNATGQMAQLIRRETGFLIEKSVLRYDGLPLTPEYILRELERQGTI